MTRRNKSYEAFHRNNLVDAKVPDALRSSQGSEDDGQGVRRIKIHDDVWSEMVLVAQYLYRIDPEAEIVDVFEFMRCNMYGGDPYSASTIKRADREVATDLGPWN